MCDVRFQRRARGRTAAIVPVALSGDHLVQRPRCCGLSIVHSMIVVPVGVERAFGMPMRGLCISESYVCCVGDRDGDLCYAPMSDIAICKVETER